MKEDIQLNLSIDEINIIFKALGERPFNEVFELIGKINVQANEQLKANQEIDLNENSFPMNGKG